FDVVAALRAAGTAILYISHRLDEVFALADRITVLRDGETVATAPRGSMTTDALVRHMAGRELTTGFPKRRVARGGVALEVQSLTSVSAGIHDVSLSVHHGEILGIAGLVGSGRTEVAELLFGLRRVDAGTIRVAGRPVTITAPDVAMAAGLAYVPEDRRRHGVLPEMSVAANTSLAHLSGVSRGGLV